jgi:hypothetical protein
MEEKKKEKTEQKKSYQKPLLTKYAKLTQITGIVASGAAPG